MNIRAVAVGLEVKEAAIVGGCTGGESEGMLVGEGDGFMVGAFVGIPIMINYF